MYLKTVIFRTFIGRRTRGRYSEDVSRTLSCFVLWRPGVLQDRDYILMAFNAITFPIMPGNKSVLLQTCHLIWLP